MAVLDTASMVLSCPHLPSATLTMMKWRPILILCTLLATYTQCTVCIGRRDKFMQQQYKHNINRRRDKLCFISIRHQTYPAHVLYNENSAVKDRLIDTNSDIIEKEPEFFVREALFVHLSPAAKILTEEFYAYRTNFITFQIERLKTVLSLESTFPNQDPNSLKYNKRIRRPLQQMLVACEAKGGKVIGFAEVDARPLGKNDDGTTRISENGTSSENILRSYMYNLAVDKNWKRKGVASQLVKAAEEYVIDMHEECVENRLYLRVRKSNEAAIGLYKSLGYREMDPLSVDLTYQDINSGSLEEGELILFSKDLPVDEFCDV